MKKRLERRRLKQVNRKLEEDNCLREGANDPGIFKAVIVIGGPGSGKSFIIKELGLGVYGLKHLVSDKVFVHLMHKYGKTLDLEKAGDYSAIRSKAKKITKNNYYLYLKGRLGLVIETTSFHLDKTVKYVKLLKRLGYDVKLVYINTSEEVAVGRNKSRDRKVPDEIVRHIHSTMRRNVKKLVSYFSEKDVIVIENSGGLESLKKKIEIVRKRLKGWIQMPSKNPKAKKWILS